MHICGIWKDVLKNLLVGQQWRNRQRTDMDMGRGEERVKMYGESNVEIYITICKIDSQREFDVYLRGSAST